MIEIKGEGMIVEIGKMEGKIRMTALILANQTKIQL